MTLHADQQTTTDQQTTDQRTTDHTADLATELAAEREHMSSGRAALARMRARTAEVSDVGADAYSSEMLGAFRSRRLQDLADDPSTPLFFGRLDFAASDPAATDPGHAPETDAPYAGESHHVGRRHVVDGGGEPMVVDWRAPVSRAFYRASAREPMGVARRRRFGFAGGELTSFEDEHLSAGEELGTASRILTAEIERPRVGPMRDIVATIQPEQDELVRADLADSLCVQGAPGTGKTAVGLHRAAFLLYTHRERLRQRGVLVVGPNRAFLSYIGQVLPALGEVDMTQLTVDELVAGDGRVAVRAHDTTEAARLKHDPRMADVLRRALYLHIGRPSEPIVVSDGSYRWRLSPEALRRMVDDARRDTTTEKLPYAAGRERVRARVVAGLQRQSEARGESPPDGWLRRMGRIKQVKAFLDAAWPAVEPAALVARLLSEPEFLAAAADGILSTAEREALRWPKPPRSVRSARWSAADAVLIDEAAGLIERAPGYGHVVVDEAQDLSPMQCRAVARRSEHGSITVLGDLAQGTSPWAAREWTDTLRHLGKPDTRIVPLTTGFRVPAAVLRLANRLLPALAVDVPAATSLRTDGDLTVRQLSDVDALATATVAATRECLSAEGSVGVIAVDSAVPALARALTAAGIPFVDSESTVDADDAAPPRVSLLPATVAKGLEFDHVIVTEPADIVAAEPRGLHRLYVVLTRAVSRLVVLHTHPLPAPLTT